MINSFYSGSDSVKALIIGIKCKRDNATKANIKKSSKSIHYTGRLFKFPILAKMFNVLNTNDISEKDLWIKDGFNNHNV